MPTETFLGNDPRYYRSIWGPTCHAWAQNAKRGLQASSGYSVSVTIFVFSKWQTLLGPLHCLARPKHPSWYQMHQQGILSSGCWLLRLASVLRWTSTAQVPLPLRRAWLRSARWRRSANCWLLHTRHHFLVWQIWGLYDSKSILLPTVKVNQEVSNRCTNLWLRLWVRPQGWVCTRFCAIL